MNSIQIQTKGTDLETITITLDEIQVSNMYELNKELNKQLTEIKKKLESSETSLKYASEARAELQTEVNEAQTLLTALGVKESNDADESWNRNKLKVTTRIAIYIANNK
jgi:hypothetical protein